MAKRLPYVNHHTCWYTSPNPGTPPQIHHPSPSSPNPPASRTSHTSAPEHDTVIATGAAAKRKSHSATCPPVLPDAHRLGREGCTAMAWHWGGPQQLRTHVAHKHTSSHTHELLPALAHARVVARTFCFSALSQLTMGKSFVPPACYLVQVCRPRP